MASATAAKKTGTDERLAEIRAWFREFKQDHHETIRTNGFVRIASGVWAENIEYLLKLAGAKAAPVAEESAA